MGVGADGTVLASPSVGTDAAGYTTIAVPIPENVDAIYVYRKVDSINSQFYGGSCANGTFAAGTYTVTDYFANAGTEYAYYYCYRYVTADGGTVTTGASPVVTQTAQKGYGELRYASGTGSASYNEETGMLSYDYPATTPTETPFENPKYVVQLRVALTAKRTVSSLKNSTAGNADFNLRSWVQSSDGWCDEELTLCWRVQQIVTTADGSESYFGRNNGIKDADGNTLTVNIPPSSVAAPVVESAAGSYTRLSITLPAEANKVYLTRKSGSGSFSEIYTRNITSAGTYTVTDCFANAGTEYTYRYRYRYDTANGSAYSDWSAVATATAHKGNGEFSLTTTAMELAYDSATGVLTHTTVPTLTNDIPSGCTASTRITLTDHATKTWLAELSASGYAGSTRDLANYFVVNSLEKYFGAEVEVTWYIRVYDADYYDKYHTASAQPTISGASDNIIIVPDTRVN